MISRIQLGIDISKRWFDVCVLAGKEASYFRYDNTPKGISLFLRAVEGLAKKHHVCMEYTGGYEKPLARACCQAGFVVSLVDGAKISHFRKSFSSSGSATDKSSSYLLALYCKQRRPAQWFEVPDEYRTLKELVRHRESLIESKTAWTCRKKSITESELVSAQKEALCQVLALQIKELEEAILALIKKHPHLEEAFQLLKTVPSIGPVSAARILAETGPIDNYACAKAYALNAGLAPITIHSGQKTPPGMLPVYGNRDLRCALFFPAVVSKRTGKGVGPFMEKIEAHGNKLKMTVITAGMRKLAHVVYGVLKNKTPFDPNMI